MLHYNNYTTTNTNYYSYSYYYYYYYYYHDIGSKASGYPIVGVLGCMAERLKSKLLEDSGVDFIAGPDAYRCVLCFLVMSYILVLCTVQVML